MDSPSPEERAERIVACDPYVPLYEQMVAREIREAESAARAKAFEEAAKIAGDHVCGCGDHATEAADAIRARAKEDPRGS